MRANSKPCTHLLHAFNGKNSARAIPSQRSAAERPGTGGRVVADAPWTLEAEGLMPGWHALVCTASDGRRWTLEVLVD